jgi:outer membrane protein assembly factor BamB
MHRFVVSLFAAILVTSPTHAQLKAEPGEWPAWRGPDRNALSKETGFLREWPKAGPSLVWKITGLGDGYATPAIAQGKIFVIGTVGAEEHVIALDVQDGKKVWSTPIGSIAKVQYAGPRSTPTIDGEWLYAICSEGKLSRIRVKDGKPDWTKNFKSEFGGRPGGWAYTESPLIDGEVLVLTPGGPKAALVALKKETGKVIWQTVVPSFKSDQKNKKGEIVNFNAGAAYSSVVAATINGTPQYVQFLAGGVVGVDAKTGKFLWHYDHPANGINISTPIVHGDTVFAASAYGVGGGLARITNDGAQEVYFEKKMQNHHGGMILVGDYLYGTGSSTLICIEFKTGQIMWNERGVGKGSLAYADGLLFHRSEGGPIALVEATPKGYVEKGRFSQPERSKVSAWAHPVVAGGRMYIRDWDILLCYDVRGDSSVK